MNRRKRRARGEPQRGPRLTVTLAVTSRRTLLGARGSSFSVSNKHKKPPQPSQKNKLPGPDPVAPNLELLHVEAGRVERRQLSRGAGAGALAGHLVCGLLGRLRAQRAHHSQHAQHGTLAAAAEGKQHAQAGCPALHSSLKSAKPVTPSPPPQPHLQTSSASRILLAGGHSHSQATATASPQPGHSHL